MDAVTRQRVAMLCDEIMRRGVPLHAVQQVIDFLDTQDSLRSTYRVVPSGGDGPLAGCHPQHDSDARLCCYRDAPKFLPVMITCPKCGDKRCARAQSCDLECSA